MKHKMRSLLVKYVEKVSAFIYRFHKKRKFGFFHDNTRSISAKTGKHLFPTKASGGVIA